jgi:hypothetical protein
LVLLPLGGYWLLPISGQVAVIPGGGSDALLWPQVRLDPAAPQPGQTVRLRITDVTPWANVLLTVDGQPTPIEDWWTNPGGTWSWEWTFVAPDASDYDLVFYHDCSNGCLERGRVVIGAPAPSSPVRGLPTKLGLVFANPARDWRGRSGWDVELTYAQLAEADYWGADDLAARVHKATAQNLRVLVRVDYAQGQSLPPTGDQLALTEYLQYVERLARDERLRGVYGYFIGSSFNSLDSNSQAPERAVTPDWYARLFNGYGQDLAHTDNVVQTVRAANPQARVLVGPVQPWNTDQGSSEAPWLDYMDALVTALDQGAQLKAEAGIPLVAPDGFALQAPGRPDAPELATHERAQERAQEPRLDLSRAEWAGAQAGFWVYRDWLAIVNAYPTTRGLPVYITSTNTFAPDQGIPPAQNYPQGWLTAALEVINQEPQVQALCWFLDYFPHDAQWEWFSLTRQPGRLIDAAEEFDLLLGN